MKQFFLYLVSLVFIGCGGNSNTNNNEMDTSNYIYQQWYLKKNTTFYSLHNIDDDAHIHGSDAIFSKYKGSNIKLAIIDNGFDVTHPELKNNVIATVAFSEDGIQSDDVSHNGDEYHGTAVAGIIASSLKLQGIAPNVELILIKMPEYITDDIVEDMFNTAISYGAQIINCSWGTNDVSQSIREYINDIAITSYNMKGVNIVFAAGNDDNLITNDESSIKNIIGVGAVDHENLRVTEYSNYGPELDIMAPGGYNLAITTLDVSGEKGANSEDYIEYNDSNGFIGTSAAAPIVSGALALLLEKDQTLTNTEIRDILKEKTDKIGINTPYIDDMVSSSSNYPIITGLLGTSRNDNFEVQLTNKKTHIKYKNIISVVFADNSFESTFGIEIPEGNYTVELVDENNFTFATDEEFEISHSLYNVTNKNIRHSDFYGYGKLNLSKLLAD